MKKICILILIMVLSYNCLAQIPPTVVYVDVNSEAIIPDLTALVTVTDNCDPINITQFPIAGTIINKGITNIILTAIDLSGNESTATGNVVAIDTIAPTIIVDTLYSEKSIEQMQMLLKAYHTTVMNAMNYAYHTGPDSIYSDSLDMYFVNPWHREVNYDNLNLVTWTNDQGNYFATFHGINTYFCDSTDFADQTLILY